ncbi:MAG: ferritin family protein [Methanobrevibacter sp.]|nr:ferritin family protein [Methanobrevibacter sp.]
MPKLKGSKTEENLKTALQGEAYAHMKYAYYASQAKKDGFVEIQDIFLETSANEKEHGKVWFKLLNGGSVPDI